MSKIRTKKPDEKAQELFYKALMRKDTIAIVDYLLEDIEHIKFKHEDDKVWWALVKQEWDELTSLDRWNKIK